jgi:hypothetical protein
MITGAELLDVASMPVSRDPEPARRRRVTLAPARHLDPLAELRVAG